MNLIIARYLLLLAFALPMPAWAVLGPENTVDNGGQTNVNSTTMSFAVTSASKIVVTVGLGCDDSGGNKNVTGITRDGQSFTQVAEVDDPAWTSVEIWQLHNPNPGTSDIVTSLAGSCAQVVTVARGYIDAAVALGTPNTAQTTGSNPSVTVVDSASGDIVVSVLSTDAGPDGATTAGGTLIFEVEDLDADIDVNTQSQVASGASTVASWTSPSSNYSAAGVAVKQAAAGGVTPRNLMLMGVGQ